MDPRYKRSDFFLCLMWLNKIHLLPLSLGLDELKERFLEIFKKPINMTASNQSCCLGSVCICPRCHEVIKLKEATPPVLVLDPSFHTTKPFLAELNIPQSNVRVWQAAVGSLLATQLGQKLDYHFTKHYKGDKFWTNSTVDYFIVPNVGFKPDFRLVTIVIPIWIYYYLKAWVNIDSLVLTIIRKHDLSDTVCVSILAQ